MTFELNWYSIIAIIVWCVSYLSIIGIFIHDMVTTDLYLEDGISELMNLFLIAFIFAAVAWFWPLLLLVVSIGGIILFINKLKGK